MFGQQTKETAQFHTIVFTEKSPAVKGDFEENFGKLIRNRYGSSVYIYYQYGLGEKVKDYASCLSSIDRIFGDIGNTTFSVKKMDDSAIGQMLVMEWKNPHIKRF